MLRKIFSRRRVVTTVLIGSAILSFLFVAYLQLGSVLPDTPEGQQMRERLIEMAGLIAVIVVLLLAAFNESSTDKEDRS